MAADALSILQVTPHPWESGHEVNEQIASLARGLADRGHRVAILTSSESRAAVRESRKLIEAAHERPASLFDRTWSGQRAGDGGPPVLALGTGISMPLRTPIPGGAAAG